MTARAAGPDGALVSRALYDRECRARAAAEALLEDRSRALAEAEAQRARDAVALRECSILSEALAALSGKSCATEAMQALLSCLRDRFAITDAVFVQASGGAVRVAASVMAEQVGACLPISADLLKTPRRLSASGGDAAALGGPFEPVRVALLAPLSIPDEAPGAILLGCRIGAGFQDGDLLLLERLCGIAAPTLTALREARRNAILVDLLEGGTPSDASGGVLDVPIRLVHRARARLTDRQGQGSSILDALLVAPLADADAAIATALGRIARLTGADRAFIMRHDPDGARLACSHDWSAPGWPAAGRSLSGMPIAALGAWRADLDAGREVLVTDAALLGPAGMVGQRLSEVGTGALLAVPLVQHDRFEGFVGFDAVGGARGFLPGDVHLVRSFGRVVAAVLSRRDAEARLAAAHRKASAQRRRLAAVLNAMPGLVVEIDRDGRFATWRSGAAALPEALARRFLGRRLEDVLPAALAASGRAVMASLDAGERAVSRDFAFAVARHRTWWRLSASGLGADDYLFVLRDITEARRRIAEIARLSEIARRTADPLVPTDAHPGIERANDAVVRATGLQVDTVKDRDPDRVLRGVDADPQAESLRRSAEAACEARARLVAAVDALQDGFVLYDADDRLVICNERYREMYPNSASAIVPGSLRGHPAPWSRPRRIRRCRGARGRVTGRAACRSPPVEHRGRAETVQRPLVADLREADPRGRARGPAGGHHRTQAGRSACAGRPLGGDGSQPGRNRDHRCGG